MSMTVFHEFTIESARRLTSLPDSHICSRLHGNTFRIRVGVMGPIDQAAGWIMDFADVAAVVEPVLDQVDHTLLNEVPGLENPTTENLAVWIWDQVKPTLDGLAEITILENATTGCRYTGA